MKRFPSLVIVLLLLINSMRSQVITITFEGTVNGVPTPLDSILVMNLTQGGDTTIYFPNNVLVLGSTGISEAGSPGFVMRGLPNPFAGSTVVVVHSLGGAALLALNDVAGRELVSHAANLAAGVHRFQLNCGRPGVHLLTVVQGGVRNSLRLMATEGAGVAGLSNVGSPDQGAPKSDRSLFTWAPGDELRYIGYATDSGIVHSAAIDEEPVATATRTFELFAGLACPESPTVTDIEGNIYRNVQIGGQCWMAENLRTATYHDGTAIPNVTGNLAWTGSTSPAWCNYQDDPGFDTTYGKLYNWYATANPNVCPLGWHMPTEAEWQQLEAALAMPASELGQLGWRGESYNVGGRMKTLTLWSAPNTGATNESGFSGLPGGDRDANGGGFTAPNVRKTWWSASEENAGSAWNHALERVYAGIARDYGGKRNGRSLRCVKD